MDPVEAVLPAASDSPREVVERSGEDTPSPTGVTPREHLCGPPSNHDVDSPKPQDNIVFQTENIEYGISPHKEEKIIYEATEEVGLSEVKDAVQNISQDMPIDKCSHRERAVPESSNLYTNAFGIESNEHDENNKVNVCETQPTLSDNLSPAAGEARKCPDISTDREFDSPSFCTVNKEEQFLKTHKDKYIFNFSDDEFEKEQQESPETIFVPDSKEKCFLNDCVSKDMMKSLNEQRSVGTSYCDVTLCIVDVSYRAHKCVLAAGSPYFHSIFSKDPSAIVHTLDLTKTAEVLESILDFIYSGLVRCSLTNIEELLQVSQQLGIQDIDRCCTVLIKENTDTNNCFFVLDIAKKFGLEDAVSSVLQVIADNFVKLHRTPGTLKLSTNDILVVLHRCNSNHGSYFEKEKLHTIMHWVIFDYEERSSFLQNLLPSINVHSLSKQDMEQIFRKKSVKKHAAFSNEVTVMFIQQVQDSIFRRIQRESRRSRKMTKPFKFRTRTLQKEVGDSDIDSCIEDDVNDADFVPTEPIIVLKKKRGRPPKKRQFSQTSEDNVKRSRGRPRKASQLSFLTVIKTEAQSEDEATAGPDAVQDQTSQEKYKTLDFYEQLKCSICGKNFKLRKQLTRHMLVHKEKTIHCSLCSYCTMRNDKLNDHLRRLHPEAAFEQGLISSEMLLLKQKARLQPSPPEKKRKMKVEVNATDPQISCLKCPRKFLSKTALKHHMKGHGAEIPFLCEVCGFSTRHHASMNVHKRQHDGTKYKCSVPGCSYTNIRRSRLTDHMSVHTGVKNHVCCVCGKAFAGRKHMQRHEKLHADTKPLCCEHCEYRSTRRDKLNEHIRKHHQSVAIAMGILDPKKVQEKLIEQSMKAPRSKQPRKKRKEDIKDCLLIDEAVDNRLVEDSPLSLEVSHNEADQVGNCITMPVSSHILGASNISEDMMQYLATMTPAVGQQHVQVHSASANAVALPALNSVHTFSQVMGTSKAHTTGTTAHLIQAQPQNDTWVYHIVPDGQQQQY